MTKSYNEFMGDLAVSDLDGRHVRMVPIEEELKMLKGSPDCMKNSTTRFKGYVKQLEALVSTYCFHFCEHTLTLSRRRPLTEWTATSKSLGEQYIQAKIAIHKLYQASLQVPVLLEP